MWRVETYIWKQIFVLSDWNFLWKKLKIMINWFWWSFTFYSIMTFSNQFQFYSKLRLSVSQSYTRWFHIVSNANVHLSLLPPFSFCDLLTSSSEFSHWSFPSLSFNDWFHFGGFRGFWGRKWSNLWKKLNFNINLNGF